MKTRRTHRYTRLLAAGAALVMTVGISVGPAQAAAETSAESAVKRLAAALAAPIGGAGSSAEVPGDQPLPGYSISNPPLTPAVVDGEPTLVMQGTYQHAGFIVELPPDWNGDLVMWAHGYRGQDHVLTTEVPKFGLREQILNQGQGWASSSYYANGFDVRAGVVSTKDLATLFRTSVVTPGRTYIAGESMGGYVIGRSLEEYRDLYDGALPLCGVLGDHALLDGYLDFNLVAQSLAGVPAYPIPADYLTNAVPRMQVATGLAGLRPGGPDTTNDLGKQLRDVTINLTGGPRPGADQAFAVWKDHLFGLATINGGDSPARRPGQLATNVGTWYTPNAPVDVNATVLRVPAENLAERTDTSLTEVPRIAGRPSVPVLTLHGIGDLQVPFSMEQIYRGKAVANKRAQVLVQRAIRTSAHCEFSPAEVGAAFTDLVNWVQGGVKPAGDDVTAPDTVAAPTFGCRFSDPAAYAGGTGTRRLYAPCS
ncbi:hypothetical protein [Micromonospora sp. NPDC047074]|uniref:hypothetical protein n=1 Tax=Micromonospora sp. NPDC047074 TaxID=3154339 RepID=UPI003402FF3A